MHTKFSYGLVKWSFFMGVAASLATACVVSSGDGTGDDTNIPEGGDGNTKPQGGSKATGGSSGTSTSGNAGEGGAEPAAGGTGTGTGYTPGLCQSDDPTPSMVPSCAASAADENECLICLKAQCCEEWQTCYGDTPTSACGWGVTAADEDLGQFDCVRACYSDDEINDGIKSETEVFEACAAACLNQCEEEGLLNDDTNDLIACARNGADDSPTAGNDDCNDVCFPPPQ